MSRCFRHIGLPLWQITVKEPSVYTMKDIAAALGVSVATVSRALRDSECISKGRREQVQRFAREHNFYPNIIAKSLRNSRVEPTKLIGVIVPQIAHYYFSTILSGIEEAAAEHGFRIMVAQSDERYEREVSICDAFLANRVCGVIVSQAKDTQRCDHFERLLARRVPLVFYDRICTALNTDRVVVDDYAGALNAVSHLIATGCRRIAFYSSPLQMEISRNRYNGYKDALLRAGLQVDSNMVYMCDDRAQAERLTPTLFGGNDAPDGFFAVNDDTAIGILYAVKRLGLRVPDDIGICGFTNGERAIACEPMLTTVEQRGSTVGREAVAMLLEHVSGRQPVDKVLKRVVRTRLVVRGTTRPVVSEQRRT